MEGRSHQWVALAHTPANHSFTWSEQMVSLLRPISWAPCQLRPCLGTLLILGTDQGLLRRTDIIDGCIDMLAGPTSQAPLRPSTQATVMCSLPLPGLSPGFCHRSQPRNWRSLQRGHHTFCLLKLIGERRPREPDDSLASWLICSCWVLRKMKWKS